MVIFWLVKRTCDALPVILAILLLFLDPSNFHPFLLTPGLYELRLGVDSSDNHSSSKPSVKCTNGFINGEKVNGDCDVSSDCSNSTTDQTIGINHAGTGSGRVEWRRIRFPKTSNALDEYTRWPRLRFRVVWHAKPHNDRLRSPVRYTDSKKHDQSVPHSEVRSHNTRGKFRWTDFYEQCNYSCCVDNSDVVAMPIPVGIFLFDHLTISWVQIKISYRRVNSNCPSGAWIQCVWSGRLTNPSTHWLPSLKQDYRSVDQTLIEWEIQWWVDWR